MGKYLNVSIVLYNSNFNEIRNVVDLLKSYFGINKIYLIDNSPSKNINYNNFEAEYIFTGQNLGYGTGHNIAIRKSIKENIEYHLVLNSDIHFDISIIEILINKMNSDSNIGLMMPKVLNVDNSTQLLPKLLPTPFNLLIRRIKPLSIVFKKMNTNYVMEQYLEKELNIPIISGCFSLFRVESLNKVGLYDENFFMYFEDFDLSRRIHYKYRTIYYPEVSIYHEHEAAARTNFKLFKEFIKSAIYYFNKYGWFFDKKRSEINKSALKNIQ